MQGRKLINYVIISLKGMAMGAADVVPGVSGGTIAFISGIYEELLNSISAINFETFKLLKSKGIKAFWGRINGNFLLALFIGIGISIVSLAKLISWLLTHEAILVWSFFFGLVLASILYIGKEITKWKIATVLLFLLGAVLAYYITTLEPLINESSSIFYLFIAGALGICAMILPGISGAFILVLLGAYKPVLEAVHSRNIEVLSIVALGAVVGLLTFSKVLKWLFSRFKNYTLAVLCGFVFGSLNKIWPWKETVTWRTNSKGIQVPFNEQSVSPLNFDGDAQLLFALMFVIIGFGVILILERLANSIDKE